jgi:hypothetical protein
MRWLLPFSSGLFLASCAAGLKPEGSPPRPESVTGILFRAPTENLAQAGRDLDTEKLAETVSRNLAAWGYPVTADAEADYSHVMEPKVSAVEGKSTPPGFSFSLGNSDPRALEFQRAEVVTVTCSVRGVARGHENAYLKQSFVADEVMKKGARAKGEKALFDAYVNHVGTACFNLLSTLKVKRNKPDPQHTPGTASSTWFPDVRIEVRDKPTAPAPRQNRDADTPTEVSAPASAETAAPAAGKTESEAPPVQTEIKEGETRKQMIIHNQGSPIILEFGYERK